MPSEYSQLISGIKSNTPGIVNVIILTHCQNDLGLSIVNTIASSLMGFGSKVCNMNLREMSMDPMEHEMNEINEVENTVEGDTIGTIEASNQWTAWKDDLALQLYNEWRATRNN
ncbi:unnamed protein product [Prunus brigantina]